MPVLEGRRASVPVPSLLQLAIRFASAGSLNGDIVYLQIQCQLYLAMVVSGESEEAAVLATKEKTLARKPEEVGRLATQLSIDLRQVCTSRANAQPPERSCRETFYLACGPVIFREATICST